MTQDYGQPRIKYKIVKDLTQKEGHRYKVVFFLFGRNKEEPIAKFRICQCQSKNLFKNITQNLEKAEETGTLGQVKKTKKKAHPEEDTGYIG